MENCTCKICEMKDAFDPEMFMALPDFHKKILAKQMLRCMSEMESFFRKAYPMREMPVKSAPRGQVKKSRTDPRPCNIEEREGDALRAEKLAAELIAEEEQAKSSWKDADLPRNKSGRKKMNNSKRPKADHQSLSDLFSCEEEEVAGDEDITSIKPIAICLSQPIGVRAAAVNVIDAEQMGDDWEVVNHKHHQDLRGKQKRLASGHPVSLSQLVKHCSTSPSATHEHGLHSPSTSTGKSQSHDGQCAQTVPHPTHLATAATPARDGITPPSDSAWGVPGKPSFAAALASSVSSPAAVAAAAPHRGGGPGVSTARSSPPSGPAPPRPAHAQAAATAEMFPPLGRSASTAGAGAARPGKGSNYAAAQGSANQRSSQPDYVPDDAKLSVQLSGWTASRRRLFADAAAAQAPAPPPPHPKPTPAVAAAPADIPPAPPVEAASPAPALTRPRAPENQSGPASTMQVEVGVRVLLPQTTHTASIPRADGADTPVRTPLSPSPQPCNPPLSAGEPGAVAAAAGNPAAPEEDPDDDVTMDPVTMEVMQDPVLAADGFTYERRVVEAWLARSGPVSALTGAPLAHTHLTPNLAVRRLVARRHPHVQLAPFRA